MNAKLIVKNFGPIESVELDLRDVNVFIGPQASGKSTLAKLYAIFRSPFSWVKWDDLKKSRITSSGGADNSSFLKKRV